MCGPFVQLFTCITQIFCCITQSLARIIMTFLAMLESLIKMMFTSIYNFLQFLFQCVSVLPLCLVFVITSKLGCGGGCCGAAGGGGGMMKCFVSIVLMVITYLILDHIGVMKGVFKHLGYQKAQNATKTNMLAAVFQNADNGVSTTTAEPAFSDFLSKLESESLTTDDILTMGKESSSLPFEMTTITSESLGTTSSFSDESLRARIASYLRRLLPTEKPQHLITDNLHRLVPTGTLEYSTYKFDTLSGRRLADSTEILTLPSSSQEPKLMLNLSKEYGLKTFIVPERLSSFTEPITMPTSTSLEGMTLLRLVDRSRVKDLLQRLANMHLRDEALPTKERKIFQPEAFPVER